MFAIITGTNLSHYIYSAALLSVIEKFRGSNYSVVILLPLTVSQVCRPALVLVFDIDFN